MKVLGVFFGNSVFYIKGSFALGDDDDDKKNRLHGNQWDFALDDDDKLQCHDVVVNSVLYPFHDDVVMTLLIHFLVVA